MKSFCVPNSAALEITNNDIAKNARINYLAKEEKYLREYVGDLESSLAINKMIVTELIKKHVWNLQEKRVIEKLTQENFMLQDQVNKLIKERDDLNVKLLISEQISEQYKSKEIEYFEDMEVLKNKYTGIIEARNYMIKILEQKLDQALSILKQIAAKDQRMKQLLRLLKLDINNPKISTSFKKNNQEFAYFKLKRDKSNTINNKSTIVFSSPRKRSINSRTNKNVSTKIDELNDNNIKTEDLEKYEINDTPIIANERKLTYGTNTDSEPFDYVQPPDETKVKRWGSLYHKQIPAFTGQSQFLNSNDKKEEETPDEADHTESNGRSNSFTLGSPSKKVTA